MPDNTNVNNSSAVVVVGRTAPVPPGQQKAEKSIPVVIASDQATIPVAEQNKVASEVALSLLGIPRSEVALGIFADVNTYDVNPSEWTSTPEQYGIYSNTGKYSDVPGFMGHGLTHVPNESGALIEAPADKTGVLTSKRFFRYQPGRVSAATFGVKTSIFGDATEADPNSYSAEQKEYIGSTIYNPSVRKYGIFDKYDGYYWETRNNGVGDNFCVVRRTQSVIFENKQIFITKQTEDYGTASPQDPLGPRGSENVGLGETSNVPGYPPQKFGDLCIYRDNLLMTHAGCYDASLLQDERKSGISSITNGDTINFVGIAKSVSNATYNINTGLMVISTHEQHGFELGNYLQICGIGMTCEYSYANDGDKQPNSYDANGVKEYPNYNRNKGFSIVKVNSKTSFTINVGLSTVPTFYWNGSRHGPGGSENASAERISFGWAIPLSDKQYVKYDKGVNADGLAGLGDNKIYKIDGTIGVSTHTRFGSNVHVTSVKVKTLEGNAVSLTDVGGPTASDSGLSGHNIITPVPFVQPVANNVVASGKTKYGTIKPSGMFPYRYENPDSPGSYEGYIDTRIGTTGITGNYTTLQTQIDDVNNYYDRWVQQNVALAYHNVYEYRIPRSRFSGDRLDGLTDTLLYSDSVADKRAGSAVVDPDTGANSTDTSIWNLEFDKVTMYKIEFSWYGAVGALFLAYVPVSNGEARWVRVHHLRASNQLKVSSLGNATLPITYMVYGGGTSDNYGYTGTNRLQQSLYASNSEHIVKYGASYYIDGGDRGTVKLFSHGTPSPIEVYGSKRTFILTGTGTSISNSNATNATDPYLVTNANSISTGLATSYYVGAKVLTGQSLDQNIEITYVQGDNVYLSAPLSQQGANGATIDIIANRPTPVVGLECRDFIQSSTGQDVRNRTQVYPTRLATGSDSLVKIDLIKSPLFQTETVIVSSDTPALETNPDSSSGGNWNIGKRGKPTKIGIPISQYTGSHANPSLSTVAGAVLVSVAANGTETNKTAAVSGTSYDSATGILSIALTGTHGLTAYTTPATGVIRLRASSISFTCSLDNYATTHAYPRLTDPIMDNDETTIMPKAGVGSQQKDADGTWSKTLAIHEVAGQIIKVRVTQHNGNKASEAEYIRDDGKGVYGWFRGYYETDPTQKKISVFGYLENRGMDRTKGISDDGYYFSAYKPTDDNVILSSGSKFLYESNSTPKDGVGIVTTSSWDAAAFTLDQLSSIKVNDQIRSPIPKTGTIVASLYAPASGENYDLSPYFDYNKEYLSFPLTDKIDSLFLCASTEDPYLVYTGDGSITPKNVSASLTWEEQ